MAEANKTLLAFNRGVISRLGLARIDLERMAMSAAEQTNWMPRVLGSMMLRPALMFIDRTISDNLRTARQVPFTFGVDDTAALEIGNANLRVRIDDVLISRPAVTSVVDNPGFDTGFTAGEWTDESESGGVASILTGDLRLNGDGTDFGIARQTVTTIETDVEHALIIDISEGPVRFKVGTVAGEDDYVAETRLETGRHSLAFTPDGDFTIEFANEREFLVRIESCDLEPVGTMDLLTPWSEDDLPFLRWEQSGDIIYIACKNGDSNDSSTSTRLTKIERRGTGRSWSVVQYQPEDGPFRVQNISGTTLTPSALVGNISIEASDPIFRIEHITFGSLWRIASQGQTVTKMTSADNGDATEPIRVVGSEAARVFSLIIEGSFSATITLQFAFSASGPWNDTSPQYTVSTSISYDDGQDNQIIFYRLIVKSGDWSSGTITMTLNYTGGSIQGVARARFLTDSTHILAVVLKDFGSIEASKDWWEGEWSQRRQYPTAVSLHEGRLWWLGQDRIWGSISDAYESYDDNQEGDAAPISRSIGFGPIKIIHWAMALGRLMFGTSENSANVAAAKMDGNHPLSARSTSFEEPMTPSNFNIKTVTSRGIFVDRTDQRIYELAFNIDSQDYESVDLSVFAPDFNEVGIVQMAVQMKPDIRIHCVRSDGTVGVLVYDRLENVICWIDVDSTGAAGEIEDVSVLPGTVEDQVYYIVKRTINGGAQRHLCKWALESEAIGGTVNKIADSAVVYSGAPTTTPFVTELLHLRDEVVTVWADGAYVGDETVSATGAITIAVAASDVVAGLGYTAQFKSAKLGDLNGLGLLERKHVNRIGFIAENLHYQGLEYGPDFDNLSDLPAVEDGEVIPADTIHSSYHEDDFPFGGEWNTDSRICLQANAPKPCTLLAAIAEMESLEKGDRRRS